MATNYPTSVDTPTDPTGSNTMDGVTGGAGVIHATQHSNANDGIVAVQNAVGFTGTFKFQGKLTPTAVKTANYNAVAGDFIPCDTTTSAFTITLPTAPTNGTMIGFKYVNPVSNRLVTYMCGGSDVLNVAGGATSGVLTIKSQSETLQYNSATAIWYLLAGDAPLGQLDLRYAPITGSSTYQAGPLTGDVTTIGAAATLVGTANVESIIRANTLSQMAPPTAAILQPPQIFTSGGTWTPGTFGAAIFKATLVGGGGGGGTASTTNGGGGGGGGEVLSDWYLGNVTGAQTITIGAGGATGGHDGNPTSIGALVTAAAGRQGSVGTFAGPGGVGGDGGGLVNSSAANGSAQPGSVGGWGAVTSGSGQTGGPGILRLGGGGGGGGGPTSGLGGNGGGSTGGQHGTAAALGGGGGGGGGGGAGHNGTSGVGGAGGDATANFGGGGGGGGAGTTPGAGGAGGPGYVIITQIA